MSKMGVPLQLLLPPLFAVAVLGFSLTLGVGAPEVRAVQIYGGPTDSKAGFLGRLRLVEDQGGELLFLEDEPVMMRVRQGSQEILRKLRTGPEGWTEFEFPRNPDLPLEVMIEAEDGTALSRGRLALSRSEWSRRARKRGLGRRVLNEGALSLIVTAENGILAVPFESAILLVFEERGVGLADALVKLSTMGGRLIGGSERRTDQKGQLEIMVAPEEHSLVLTVEVETGSERAHFEQPLPVVPGALSLTRDGKQWWIESPIPRSQVWFTLVTGTSRRQGGPIALEVTTEGRYRGPCPHLNTTLPKDAYLVLSGDATGLSLGTVGFPLQEQGETFDVSDLLLLDSLPGAKQAAISQGRRLRLVLGSYVLVAGLVTIVLFWIHLRRAEKNLSAELQRVGATPGAKESSSLPIFTAIVALFFAFSLAVLWIVAR